MSLVADYSNTDSDSSTSESESEEQQIDANTSKKQTLPSASALFSNDAKAGEVFQTKYHKEEQAKKASLERHVKMVENDEHLTTKNGRKICWNFRKGRCRFGTKCQYAHDSDLLTETPAQTSSTNSNKQTLKTASDQGTDAQQNEDESKQHLKRKRPGLGDSITPGKRVMKAYKQHNKK